jgi:hypothetical protein
MLAAQYQLDARLQIAATASLNIVRKDNISDTG